MLDDQHVIPVNWCRTLIDRVLDFRPAKSDSLRPAPRGEKKDAYKLKDLWDEDGSAAAAGSLDGMSSPKHPPIMVRSLATMAEAIHDCESLRYFCSRDGPEMVRASGTEERRVLQDSTLCLAMVWLSISTLIALT